MLWQGDGTLLLRKELLSIVVRDRLGSTASPWFWCTLSAQALVLQNGDTDRLASPSETWFPPGDLEAAS